MEKRNGFSINESEDLLSEIFSRLDGKSLGVAACVCRLWRRISSKDAVWEKLCGLGREARAVVAALGGYQRLYSACVGPVQARKVAVRGGRVNDKASSISWSSGVEARLSLSLFSIYCYERLAGNRSSLMFLCSAR